MAHDSHFGKYLQSIVSCPGHHLKCFSIEVITQSSHKMASKHQKSEKKEHVWYLAKRFLSQSSSSNWPGLSYLVIWEIKTLELFSENKFSHRFSCMIRKGLSFNSRKINNDLSTSQEKSALEFNFYRNFRVATYQKNMLNKFYDQK